MSNLQIGIKKYYLRSVASLLILFVFSCNEKNAPENPENTLKQEIMEEELTIESAKQWFDTKVKNKSNARTSAKKDPLWNYATQVIEKDGSTVIITPIVVEEKYQNFGVVMKQEDSPKIMKQLESQNYRDQMFSTPQKLIMYKDSLGKVHTMRMEIVADYEYFEKSLKTTNKAKNDGKDFSGTVFFYHWDDADISEGLHYKNGKFKGVYEPNKSVKKGRLAGCSTTTYSMNVPCSNGNNAKLLGSTCWINWEVTDCTYDSFGGVFDVSINSLPMFFMDGGGAYVGAISSSYRANQVDNFLAQASNYGVTHNPDERLDFIDNFDVFLKVKDDYLKAIKKWGSAGIQYLEDQLDALFLRSITQGERNALSQHGNFSSYRINLMLYLWNAYEATNVAESVMNSLPDPNNTIDGSVARNCGWCRGNAIKHAAWNIKNAHTFNKWLAQTLGTAHEYGQLGATRDMDLHNNAIGISLFESYEADGALSMLKDVLMNGMPGNSSNGFKFIIVDGSNPVLHWTKDYPNEN
jgi:hypothetical protein